MVREGLRECRSNGDGAIAERSECGEDVGAERARVSEGAGAERDGWREGDEARLGSKRGYVQQGSGLLHLGSDKEAWVVAA